MALINRYIVYEHEGPINTPCDHIDPNIKIITNIDQLNVIDIDQLKKIEATFSQVRFEKLLNNGMTLMLYINAKVILGMMCGIKGSCYIRGPALRLIQEQDDVYWFWIFTMPEARGKKIYTKLRDYFFRYYNEANKIRALVRPDNLLMKSEFEKHNFFIKSYIFSIKLKGYIFSIEKNYVNKNFMFKFTNEKKVEITII